jgi:hypothetical protein
LITSLLSTLRSAIFLTVIYLTFSARTLNHDEREMVQKQVMVFIRKFDLKAINA